MAIPSALAVQLLDHLEQAERKLLVWGYTEAGFSADEIEQHARTVAATDPVGGNADQIIGELLEGHWLWQVPNRALYRTRFAETVRLLSKLRQIRVYPNTPPERMADLWRAAPPLVADYRLLVQPRRFPRRDIAPAAIEEALGLTHRPLERSVCGAFLGVGGGHERRLSGFQVRATSRILRTPHKAGTVVCAGTGSGKTLAFYLPAFLRLAPLLDQSAWVKCIALYPRNELLKDQLREALAAAARVRPALAENKRRGLTIGAIYGDVKEDAAAVAGKYGWETGSFKGQRGRVCPFVRCPMCTEVMFWSDTDRNNGVEMLRCSSVGCTVQLGTETIRLTRASLRSAPPDILFTSTEMLNRNLRSSSYAKLFGLGLPQAQQPGLLLLDEVHTYEGSPGAHVATLLRRWHHASGARPHVVGLSATLEEAERFFAELTGLPPSFVQEIAPEPDELEAEGADYQLALRGDPSWGTSLLSTTIQTIMLLRRILEPQGQQELSLAGKRVFAFSDRLDGINRLFENLRDAEGRSPRSLNQVLATRTVLAGLRGRGPDQEAGYAERMLAGQAWPIVEAIGHKLQPTPNYETSLNVHRTSSQDTGVEANADVVVATASLEVGYDDPYVGAVVQHKAPRSSASFLQRKGRAGRLRQTRADGTTVSMRPWTVVVLSDFGRDRVAYQNYEHIFTPVLAPRHLPLASRALLRVQATYTLFDYLGKLAAGAGLMPDPWVDLARRAMGPWPGEVARAQRQVFYRQQLERLLEATEQQSDFASFVCDAMALPLEEVQALLWEPPRAVLLEAVPTLLRRLATSWRRAFEDASSEPMERSGPPLPEFVQRTLFTELMVPEVAIVLSEDEADKPEGMVLGDALREFAPGRVSKRFDIQGSVSHWIDPGSELTLDVSSFCAPEDRIPLGRFTYREGGQAHDVDVYRPYRLRAASPPNNIGPTSNARALWRSQLVATAPGYETELPQGSPLGNFVDSFRFHTHHLGCPIEVRRFVVGSSVAISRVGGKREPERVVRYKKADGKPVGLGWASEVDALAFQVRYPSDLRDRVKDEPELLRALRTLRFRALVRSDPQLDGLLNGFQRDALVEAYLVAVLLKLERDPTAQVSTAGAELKRVDVQLALKATMVSRGDADEDEEEQPRRLQELLDVLDGEVVLPRLREGAAALWEPVGADWEDWLRGLLRATLGASLRQAIIGLCPSIDEDDLIIESNDDVEESDVDLWITESAVGGGGALEMFYATYARDPRLFVRLWVAALEPSDSERVAGALEAVVELLAGERQDIAVQQGAGQIRAAFGHAEASRALTSLRSALGAAGFPPETSLMTALFARVLRPGSSPGLDGFLCSTLGAWRALEERAGIHVETKAFALVQSETSGLEDVAPGAPVGEETALRTWRQSTLTGLLWRRPESARREALAFTSPFVDPPDCDRLIVRLFIGDPGASVDLSAATWFEELSESLTKEGIARLRTPCTDRKQLAAALRRIATEPIDTGGLQVFPHLGAVRHGPSAIEVIVEMPEALQ